MFTGIVAAVGRIQAVHSLGATPDAGIRVTVHAGSLDLADVALGDSIAIQGACMTVIAHNASAFDVEVSRESLNCTVGLTATGEVNLEKALCAHDRLGGHLVTGHIDGIGVVTHFSPVGESYLLRVRAPRALSRYLACKGSITINGVSLTVNTVDDHADGCEFSVNLIAHTIEVTTLKHLRLDTAVNLEIDLIARYVERMMSRSTQD